MGSNTVKYYTIHCIVGNLNFLHHVNRFIQGKLVYVDDQLIMKPHAFWIGEIYAMLLLIDSICPRFQLSVVNYFQNPLVNSIQIIF